jgi:hypothetical protein
VNMCMCVYVSYVCVCLYFAHVVREYECESERELHVPVAITV